MCNCPRDFRGDMISLEFYREMKLQLWKWEQWLKSTAEPHAEILNWCMESHNNSNKRSPVQIYIWEWYLHKINCCGKFCFRMWKKIWSKPLRRDCYNSLRGIADKTDENHLNCILAWHFLMVYISLLTLGNELQYKSSGENVPTHIMKQQQNKEFQCPGNSAALQKEGMARTVSSAPHLLSSLGPWDSIMATDVCYWSLLSLPMFTRLTCTSFTSIQLFIYCHRTVHSFTKLKPNSACSVGM